MSWPARRHNLRILKNVGLPANEETLPGVADKAHRSLRKSTARRDRKPEVIWKSGTGEVTVIVSERLSKSCNIIKEGDNPTIKDGDVIVIHFL